MPSSSASDASRPPGREAVTMAPSGPLDGSSPKRRRPWYQSANPLRWRPAPDAPTEPLVSPEYEAGFLSKLTFQWMTPLMSTGYKRSLEKSDIWAVNPDRAVEPLTRRLKEAFQRRLAKGQSHPLFWALLETFKFEFWIAGIGSLLAVSLQVLAPFTLRYLIQFATDAYDASIMQQPAPPIGNGIGLAIGIAAMLVLQSFCMSQFIYRGMMLGGQARAVLIGLIYEKAMVVSGRAKAGRLNSPSPITDASQKPNTTDHPGSRLHPAIQKVMHRTGAEKRKLQKPGEESSGWANGRIMNLMSVDTYRIDQASALLHLTWTAPVACIITLVVLLVNLSYSALAGFALLVIGVPALTAAIRSLFRRRKKINKITDERVSLTQEILQSVRLVKFYGWEKAFLRRLAGLRYKEIHAIQALLAIRNAINAFSMSLPVFASMLSFIVYSLTNNGLDPARIFSSLALFNGLRVPLNLLPVVLGQVADAWSSMNRVEEFLLEEEQEDDFVYKPEGDNAIQLHHASFTWERPALARDSGNGEKTKGVDSVTSDVAPKTDKVFWPALPASAYVASEKTEADEGDEPFQLRDIDFRVGRDELIAVIGSVGSGKSSLLAALAGDMRKTDGTVVLGASRAFCPQYAWIQNTTLRNNITFGKPMDRERYDAVVEACALEADIDMLPNGDETEIGERGITISGGQKQRLNIARAIYFDADIVLMDDPLSAVDAHVGRQIFDRAILGLLKNKCRILATHQLWVLRRCDRIAWMDGGRVRAIGTYDELFKDHESFRKLVETTTGNDETANSTQPEQKSVDADAMQGKSDTGDEGEEVGGEDEDATKPQNPQHASKAVALMQQEDKAEASVPWSVYGAYVRASGSILNAPLALALLLLSQGANIATGLWLSYWTSQRFGLATGQYMGIYAGLGGLQALLMFAFSLLLSILGTRASRAMLHEAVYRVLRAPVSFFDTTPLGRITNRFSRDVDVMDNNLTDAIRMFFFTLAMVCAVLGLIIAFFPFFAVALGPLCLLFVLAASYYRASARQVKRFESVLRSDVFAKFGEGLGGVASIRAYGLRDGFAKELRASIDEMDAAYFLTFSNQRWLSIRLDLVGSAVVLTVGILVVTSRFRVGPSISGLVMSYVLAIVQMLQFSVRQMAEVENGMNAVERLHHYGTRLEQEAPLETVAVREDWPEKGDIVLEAVKMRYREKLPLVLDGISMHIRGGERMGIVGRTGAGKSSIVSCLFRLVELSSGSITIDGLDIATIGLGDLRSRLAMIPQDPSLFRGTVRSNLDPFGEHDDQSLWSALRQAGLAPADGQQGATRLGLSLDGAVEEDGLNLSLGQRQQMALARALVRGSKIIVCDEATSAVDLETDAQIQATMATAFAGKTLLCIAHRLRTVLGYDRICVLDGGRIAELDAPLALWHRGGLFRRLCDRSGIGADEIRAAAESASA